jgi:hypothetical protein
MEKDQERLEEIHTLMNQMEHEIEILAHSVDNIDEDYEAEYSRKVMRSELQQIGDLVESFANVIGEGEAVSVADVPITEEED